MILSPWSDVQNRKDLQGDLFGVLSTIGQTYKVAQLAANMWGLAELVFSPPESDSVEDAPDFASTSADNNPVLNSTPRAAPPDMVPFYHNPLHDL